MINNFIHILYSIIIFVDIHKINNMTHRLISSILLEIIKIIIVYIIIFFNFLNNTSFNMPIIFSNSFFKIVNSFP